MAVQQRKFEDTIYWTLRRTSQHKAEDRLFYTSITQIAKYYDLLRIRMHYEQYYGNGNLQMKT